MLEQATDVAGIRPQTAILGMDAELVGGALRLLVGEAGEYGDTGDAAA